MPDDTTHFHYTLPIWQDRLRGMASTDLLHITRLGRSLLIDRWYVSPREARDLAATLLLVADLADPDQPTDPQHVETLETFERLRQQALAVFDARRAGPDASDTPQEPA